MILFTLLVLFLTSTSANAWEGWTQVDELTLYPGSHLEIKLSQVRSHGCSPDNAFFTLNLSDPTTTEKTIYTLLLLALMGYQEIYVTTQGCQDGFEKVNSAKIDPLSIEQIINICESCADLEGIELVSPPYLVPKEHIAARR
jgi:hypothetical protein